MKYDEVILEKEAELLLKTNKCFSFEEIRFIPNTAGIYIILNTVNNKKYVGQSINLQDRMQDHKWLGKNTGKYHLYNAIKKYGIDNFLILLIETFYDYDETLINDILDKQEEYYVTKYKTSDPNKGYNNTAGGRGLKGTTMSEERKQEVGKLNIKKTYAYNFNEGYYLEAESRVNLVELINERGYNITTQNIYDAVRDNSYSKDFIFADSLEELNNKIGTVKTPEKRTIYLYNFKDDYYGGPFENAALADKFIRSKGYRINGGHTHTAIAKNNKRIKDFLFGETKEELEEKIKNFEPYVYTYCIADGFFMQFKSSAEAIRILNSMGYKLNLTNVTKAVNGYQRHSAGFIFAKSMDKLMDKIYNFNIDNAEIIYKTAEEHNLLNTQKLIEWQDKINVISVK